MPPVRQRALTDRRAALGACRGRTRCRTRPRCAGSPPTRGVAPLGTGAVSVGLGGGSTCGTLPRSLKTAAWSGRLAAPRVDRPPAWDGADSPRSRSSGRPGRKHRVEDRLPGSSGRERPVHRHHDPQPGPLSGLIARHRTVRRPLFGDPLLCNRGRIVTPSRRDFLIPVHHAEHESAHDRERHQPEAARPLPPEWSSDRGYRLVRHPASPVSVRFSGCPRARALRRDLSHRRAALRDH